MKKTKIILNLLSCFFIPLVVVILLILCYSNNTSETSTIIFKEQSLQTEGSIIPASQEANHFSNTTTSAKSNRTDVDEFITAYYQAGRKGINIFDRKETQNDLAANEELNSRNDKYLAQRETLINCVLGMFNKYGFTGAVIGLTGFCLIIWLVVATLCEFIRYFILCFFSYVVSRFV